MPIMNGFICAEKIKNFYNQNELFGYNEAKEMCPYLVACSAHITPEIEEKARKSGFNDVYQSPL